MEIKEKNSFDKTCITPGTNFMKKLDYTIKNTCPICISNLIHK